MSNPESLEVLLRARQELDEAEEMAIQTLMNLALQRESIDKISRDSNETTKQLDRSNTLLNRMLRCWKR